mgnify:CR=1 FL=1
MEFTLDTTLGIKNIIVIYDVVSNDGKAERIKYEQ